MLTLWARRTKQICLKKEKYIKIGLSLWVLFIYGCQWTANSDNTPQESVQVTPIPSDSTERAASRTADDARTDSADVGQEGFVGDEKADIPEERGVQKTDERKDITIFIPVSQFQDSSLKTFALKADSLTEEKVYLSVLTSAERVPLMEDKIIVRIYNYSADTLMGGNHYKLEYWDNGKWVKVGPPKNAGFEDLGYPINAFEAREFIVPLFPDRHVYRPGRYRVTKPVNIIGKPWPKGENEISAEFDIR